MPLIRYEDWNPRGDAWNIAQNAREIAAAYEAQGYDLTLRQLYYQFVSRDLLPNNQKSYDKLGIIINKARLAGLIDWNHIVDRTRELKNLPHWDSPAEIIEQDAGVFQIDRWEGQPTRVEVWVEKEALAGVVERAAQTFDCAWFSCRGYVSQSEMWIAAQRIRCYIESGQDVTILHLGDHDPSGIDMTRDITDRLERFIAVDLGLVEPENLRDDDEQSHDSLVEYGIDNGNGYSSPLEIDRIALNFDQVQQYNPPPNPAKITDSRAEKYIRRFGRESWELDALEPATLNDLIQVNIRANLDIPAYNAKVAELQEHKTLLRLISSEYSNIVDNFLTMHEPESEDEDGPD